ncbi:hypothetical protein PMAYCL1PPCAC_19131, partial [Pristionchus mayeri]
LTISLHWNGALQVLLLPSHRWLSYLRGPRCGLRLFSLIGYIIYLICNYLEWYQCVLKIIIEIIELVHLGLWIAAIFSVHSPFGKQLMQKLEEPSEEQLKLMEKLKSSNLTVVDDERLQFTAIQMI